MRRGGCPYFGHSPSTGPLLGGSAVIGGLGSRRRATVASFQRYNLIFEVRLFGQHWGLPKGNCTHPYLESGQSFLLAPNLSEKPRILRVVEGASDGDCGAIR